MLWTSPVADLGIIMLPCCFFQCFPNPLDVGWFSAVPLKNFFQRYSGPNCWIQCWYLLFFLLGLLASFDCWKALFSWEILLPWLPQSSHALVCLSDLIFLFLFLDGIVFPSCLTISPSSKFSFGVFLHTLRWLWQPCWLCLEWFLGGWLFLHFLVKVCCVHAIIEFFVDGFTCAFSTCDYFSHRFPPSILHSVWNGENTRYAWVEGVNEWPNKWEVSVAPTCFLCVLPPCHFCCLGLQLPTGCECFGVPWNATRLKPTISESSFSGCQWRCCFPGYGDSKFLTPFYLPYMHFPSRRFYFPSMHYLLISYTHQLMLVPTAYYGMHCRSHVMTMPALPF